jgi:hypothetical protein
LVELNGTGLLANAVNILTNAGTVPSCVTFSAGNHSGALPTVSLLQRNSNSIRSSQLSGTCVDVLNARLCVQLDNKANESPPFNFAATIAALVVALTLVSELGKFEPVTFDVSGIISALSSLCVISIVASFEPTAIK